MGYLNNLNINKAMDNLGRFEALVTRLLLTTYYYYKQHSVDCKRMIGRGLHIEVLINHNIWNNTLAI